MIRAGEGNVMTEVEIGLMQPQAAECWQLLDAGGDKEHILLWSLLQEPALQLLPCSRVGPGLLTVRIGGA